MKRIFAILTACLLSLTAQAKPLVVTTLPNFADIVRHIGGDDVTVKSLLGTGVDPHFADAKPTFLVDLNRADLLIHTGAELEIGWLPPLLTQSGNGKIKPGQNGHLDLSRSVNLIEVATGKISRAMGDVHPSGNPHYFLSPGSIPGMARAIAGRLQNIDAPNAGKYQSRLQSFLSQWNEKMSRWRSLVGGHGAVNVVSYHRSISYLVAWLGWNLVDTIEAKPGVPPSSARLSALVESLPKAQVKLIISENWYPAKDARFLAQKIDVPIVAIDGLTNDNAAYFDRVFNALAAAVK